MDLIVLFGPVILGNDNAGAAGQAQENTNQHFDDGTDGPNSGIRFIADKIAHNPCVHCVV